MADIIIICEKSTVRLASVGLAQARPNYQYDYQCDYVYLHVKVLFPGFHTIQFLIACSMHKQGGPGTIYRMSDVNIYL